MNKKVILIVLDSAGIGELPDAEAYNDKGSNTIAHIYEKMRNYKLENMEALGLAAIKDCGLPENKIKPLGAYGKLKELSAGKDTTTGHWEIAGIVTETPFPTFSSGFPEEVINKFTNATGLNILCNKVMSGTEVIKLYGEEHIKTGFPIVYTSADSVFQIAAHEEVIPPEELYDICRKARTLCDDYNILRVIARPFVGNSPQTFKRTSNRRDFSIPPADNNMLINICKKGLEVCAVGKIEDIYAGKGITKAVHTTSNQDGIEKTLEYMDACSPGLIFSNLVDFDMLYGHRNDVEGYASALKEFDAKLPEIIGKLGQDDILVITADHGCDPTTESTDHSREYIPLLIYGKRVKSTDLGIRDSFADIGATICDYLEAEMPLNGKSFLQEMLK